MALTQFAMVEELASLIKDNLYSKHLILSTEEALINYLQDGSCADGILELQPASSYNRLLLHRLAEIYGFAHESVGEGDNRHLVLERCSDTAIPQVLVSDILWQNDDSDTTEAWLVLQRGCAVPSEAEEKPLFPSGLVQTLSPSASLKDRAAAYEAARARIFSLHEDKEESVRKPRSVPFAAQRMIAHALGHKLSLSHESSTVQCREGELNELEKSNDAKGATTFHKSKAPGHSMGLHKKVGDAQRYMGHKDTHNGHTGAAKRMFARALGLQSEQRNACSPANPE